MRHLRTSSIPGCFPTRQGNRTRQTTRRGRRTSYNLGTSCKKSRHHRESESKTPDSSPRHGHPVPTLVPSCAKTGCVTPSAKAGNNATSGNARIAALIRESFPQSQQCWRESSSKRKNLCLGVLTRAYIVPVETLRFSVAGPESQSGALTCRRVAERLLPSELASAWSNRADADRISPTADVCLLTPYVPTAPSRRSADQHDQIVSEYAECHVALKTLESSVLAPKESKSTF